MDGLVNFTGSLSGSIEEGGGGGVTPHVTATASVNDETGTPSVTVVRSGPDSAPNFAFQFQNLKGERGETGSQGIPGVPGPAGSPGSQGPRGFTGQTGATGPAGSDGYSPAVTIEPLSDPNGHRITITDEQHPLGQSFDVMDGVDGSDGSQGPQGPQGNPGAGVAVGGTDGQILAKNGSADYQTQWIDPTPDALPVISDEYDDYTAYSVGDYCIRENTLYKCNTDITPYEVWDPTHWDACTVGEEITTINASLAHLPDTMKYGTEEVIDLTNTTTFTATSAGFITGYFRKSADTTNDGLLGITSNKAGNAFVFIQSIPKALNGGYGSVTLPVVKGEILTFATLNNINLSASRISFRPLLMS